VIIVSDDGTAMYIEINGGTPATNTHARAFGTPTKLTLGSRDGAAEYPGNIYAALNINRLLTTDEKADVRTKMAAASGAILS